MNKDSKIYLAGHTGMVGSAIHRKLIEKGFRNIITRDLEELDLANQILVESFFKTERPEIVILAAAKVGGIKANMNNQASFLRENLEIQTNVIHQASLNACSKLVFLGSSCIYPKNSPQPMKEEYLLSGKLEPTNEGYALAKIVGLKMAYFYSMECGLKTLSLMPSNLYGTNDSFNLETSHVLSALVKRFSDAQKEGKDDITLWGTGIARREFMHVEDFADAFYFLLQNYDSPDFINVGTAEDISIAELANLIANKVGFNGEIKWNHNMPDGTLQKKMDVSRLFAMGYQPTISLEKGIEMLIQEYSKINQ